MEVSENIRNIHLVQELLKAQAIFKSFIVIASCLSKSKNSYVSSCRFEKIYAYCLGPKSLPMETRKEVLENQIVYTWSWSAMN